MRSLFCIPLALLLTACDSEPAPAVAAPTDAAILETGDSNTIAIPPVVRRNLGITFAEAVYRPVAATVTVPGHFEVRPSAQHHYPMPAAGRVTVLVEALDTVTAGQLLVRLDAPAWRSLQRELVEARSARAQVAAELARARAARSAVGDVVATNDNKDVYNADVLAAEARLVAVRERFEHLLAEASTLTGVSLETLREETDGRPYWQRLDGIPIQAVEAGVVQQVDASSGTWVAEGTEVVHLLHPTTLRFRGKALQADLIDHIRDGQPVSMLPPEGRGRERRTEAVRGHLRIGVTGDPEARTVDVFVDIDPHALQPWMRPQVTALAEVAVAGDPDMDELAIPVRAVIQDGMDTVFFRRDPDNQDVVIRTKADLGPSDGRWVSVYSGLGEGDQVVVDGVYQLKLATTGQDVEAGHFHADGTWHEEAH